MVLNKVNEIRIHYAIEFGKPRIFKRELKNKANLELSDSKGNTPLLNAVYFDRPEFLEQLLKVGADLDARNLLGLNALMVSAATGNLGLAQKLLEYDPKLDLKGTLNGETALYIAAAKGHGNIVDLLLNAGANPTIQAHSGKIPKTVALANHWPLIAAKFGDEGSHFKVHSSSKSRSICGFCGTTLSSSETATNFCEDCEVPYCNHHYEWTGWKSPNVTCVWMESEGSCPNGHIQIQSVGP